MKINRIMLLNVIESRAEMVKSTKLLTFLRTHEVNIWHELNPGWVMFVESRSSHPESEVSIFYLLIKYLLSVGRLSRVMCNCESEMRLCNLHASFQMLSHDWLQLLASFYGAEQEILSVWLSEVASLCLLIISQQVLLPKWKLVNAMSTAFIWLSLTKRTRRRSSVAFVTSLNVMST